MLLKIWRRLPIAAWFVLGLALAPAAADDRAFSTWLDFNPQIERGEKKNYNLLPLFVSSPERGQGFGLKYAQQSLLNREDVVRVQAIQTLLGKSSYDLVYEFPPRSFGMEMKLTYENFTKFYYGIGSQSREEDESAYDPELIAARVPLLYGLSKHVSAGVSFDYQEWKMIRADANGILPRDSPHLIGTEQSRLYTTGLLMRWDSRNSRTNPTHGLFAEGSVEYAKSLVRAHGNFTRAAFETRAFHPFWNHGEHHVFGLRLFLDYTSGDVPFYRLPELGGIFFNRGLLEGRFRDSLAVTGNIEYRFRITDRLHWAFFTDAGNVYPRLRAVNFRRTKFTGGTGMRYYVPPGNLLLARVDGGLSSEGFRVYLTFDHPF
ncbi:MAG: hypothetical protein A2636_07250 [Elusimicrobia bacterium RIFCSPHIGHO2_01_FULL_64_10]|nr:MAG: hypothetical protein A2636_07250 [Elusimicrobia bacterium RIFCSPHIGHO2_01_FULL_64_10]